jgi:hypothetical protein
MLKPSLHHDFQIDDRVFFDIGSNKVCSGTITGIASQHIIFTYIITLDKPLTVDGYAKPWRTVTMPGGCLNLG